MQHQFLKTLEQKEFEKTREFIRSVAGLYTEVDTIHKVTFDNKPVNENLRQFFIDNYQGSLKKASLDFNTVNQSYVMRSMQILISWCFKHRIQPYSLRQIGLIGIKEITFDYIETEFI